MTESAIKYECCICKETVASGELAGSNLDPCELLLIVNFDKPREEHKEQSFFCHFECFRTLVNNDGIMCIMDDDFPTVGECDEETED
jgi:hypothetical protein